jgi:hypothetical protein
MIDRNLVPPLEIGQRVLPADLIGWVYSGLSGKPGESGASRRYTKGIWVLELIAHADRKRRTSVVTIRTQSDDKQWWAEKAAL